MTNGKCIICKVAVILAAIGAINWGLVGFMDMDLVAKILGTMTTAAKVVYGLIAVSGVLLLLSTFKCCPGCKKA